jgi:hypothetical protein
MKNSKAKNSKKSTSNAQKSEKRVTAPLASGTVIKKVNARINNNNSYTIRNREYYRDIVAVTNITGGGKINPGNVQMFPWASRIAKEFDQFRFKKLHFVWKSRCPANTDGKIAFAVDYDPEDVPVSDLRALETFEGCVSVNVWVDEVLAKKEVSFRCDIAKLHPNGRRKYICNNGYCPNGDLQDLFCGRFIFITDTAATLGINLGEFWVDYEIELFAPESAAARISQTSIDAYAIQLNATNTNWFNCYRNTVQTIAPVTAANAFTNGSTVVATPSGVIQIDSGTGIVSRLVSGLVRVSYNAIVNSSTGSNCSLLAYVNGVASTQVIVQGVYTTNNPIYYVAFLYNCKWWKYRILIPCTSLFKVVQQQISTFRISL